jgi:hypothetical protein
LHWLRGVFLAALGAEGKTQIQSSFCEAIRIAKEQKSVSLLNRAEAIHAEYRRQTASTPGGRGFGLPLWSWNQKPYCRPIVGHGLAWPRLGKNLPVIATGILFRSVI